MKTWLKKLWRALLCKRYPVFKLDNNPFVTLFWPGHYYSPLPDSDYIEKNQDRLFNSAVKACPGIDLGTEDQIKLIDSFRRYAGDFEITADKIETRRYFYNNTWFCCGDAFVLYCMMRHYKPEQIIEVGSGFSSALMLDVNDIFYNSSMQFTFIEPYPERLKSLMRTSDSANSKILVQGIQDVPLEVFKSLKRGDILFVDSSHVTKIGSDVNYIIFEVLPVLAEGVVIHFHDILWPFEYPHEWLKEGKAWNEAYLLRAFLQYNHAFKILFFNSFIGAFYSDEMKQAFPMFSDNPGGSLWLQKNSTVDTI